MRLLPRNLINASLANIFSYAVYSGYMKQTSCAIVVDNRRVRWLKSSLTLFTSVDASVDNQLARLFKITWTPFTSDDTVVEIVNTRLLYCFNPSSTLFTSGVTSVDNRWAHWFNFSLTPLDSDEIMWCEEMCYELVYLIGWYLVTHSNLEYTFYAIVNLGWGCWSHPYKEAHQSILVH